MKFSHLKVVRVGKHVTLCALRDFNPAVGDENNMQVNFDAPTMEEAQMFEALFQRMILAANAFEDTSDDVLQATLNLSKGRQDEHD